MAIARRRIKTGGDVKAALSLIPITKPVYARYRGDARGRVPAPRRLVLARATLDVDNDRDRRQPRGHRSGTRPGSGRLAACKAPPSRRAPPADVAGRRPRAAGPPERWPRRWIRPARERRAAPHRGRPPHRRHAPTRCAAGRRRASCPTTPATTGRRPRSPTRGSSPACASAGTRSQEIREATADGQARLRLRRGPAPGARAASTRVEEAAEETGLEPALDRADPDARSASAGRRSCSPSDDVQLLRYVAAVLAAGFPLVAFLQLVRVYGQALAQIADAEVRLFHLYVHEPLMRDGVAGLEMAEEMEGLARELLPLASPIMDHVHQRFLPHFVEQDVIGHMEADLDDGAARPRAPARRDRLRRPRRLHAADRGGGRGGGRQRRRALHRGGRAHAARRRADHQDDRRRGDGRRLATPAALVDWAVGFQAAAPTERPLPRIGMHYGATLYRDGDYFGREVNLASRVAARAAGGEVLVTRPVVERGGPAPGVRAASARCA